MLVFLSVGVGEEVSIELQVQQGVPVVQDPGHGEVMDVAALLLAVLRPGDLPLVTAVQQAGADDTVSLLKYFPMRNIFNYFPR